MNGETRKILASMRMMAWERAKGELQAMLMTFHSGGDVDDKKQFEALQKAIKEFVELIHNEGLADG